MQMNLLPAINPMNHWPEIAQKKVLTDGRTVYGVICGPCSARLGDYRKCQFIDEFPENVITFTEPLR